MGIRFRAAITLALLAVVLSPVPVTSAADNDFEEPGPPTSYLEFYERAFECLYYFGRMSEELKEREAAAEEAARYEELGFSFIWALSGFDSVLSQRELESVTEAEINQRLEAHADLDALRGAYDAMCKDLRDNWKAHYDGIVRRLEEQSGELYLDLKGECVTVATDLLSVNGEYMGMSGPSIKKVPRGGLKIPDPTGEDSFKVALPRGSLAYFATVEIPAPPKKHLQIMEMPPEDQARTLVKPVRKWGWDCRQPEKPFFRGFDQEGEAYWAVSCETGKSFSVGIDTANEIHYRYDCESTGGYQRPECYKPCERQSCYTVDPSVGASVEYIPYTAETRVERAPDERCKDMSGSVQLQFRGDLPKLKRGKAHNPAMAVIDALDCSALSTPLQLTLEIYATQHLNMLDLDLETLEVPSLAFDFSAGPPCELVHADPLDSEYADLRCRLTGDPDAVMANGPTLAVRGRFNNGDPFEGKVEACRSE